MKKLLIGAAIALTTMVGAASAATLNITGLTNINASDPAAGGFGSSLIHEATGCSGMCGATALQFNEDASGIWTDTGTMIFSGSFIGGTYSANGYLERDIASFSPGSFIGYLSFAFSGGIFDGQTLEFDFNAMNMGLPNSFDGSTVFLWGGQAVCFEPVNNPCSGNHGIDLRIEVAAVPLPASALLLIAGVGALGVARRKRTA